MDETKRGSLISYEEMFVFVFKQFKNHEGSFLQLQREVFGGFKSGGNISLMECGSGYFGRTREHSQQSSGF